MTWMYYIYATSLMRLSNEGGTMKISRYVKFRDQKAGFQNGGNKT